MHYLMPSIIKFNGDIFMKIFFIRKNYIIMLIFILIISAFFIFYFQNFNACLAIELSKNSAISDEAISKISNLTNGSEKIAFLTFDDGPNASVTPKVLDILKDENVSASFFVIGKNVDNLPEIVKRAYEEGHFIANHGYDHNNSVLYKNNESFINEIKNIVITVVVATSVVQGSLTLSFLCLIRIEQEQPSSNICSFYKRNIDERWILYSPQRLILPIQGNVH